MRNTKKISNWVRCAVAAIVATGAVVLHAAESQATTKFLSVGLDGGCTADDPDSRVWAVGFGYDTNGAQACTLDTALFSDTQDIETTCPNSVVREQVAVAERDTQTNQFVFKRWSTVATFGTGAQVAYTLQNGCTATGYLSTETVN